MSLNDKKELTCGPILPLIIRYTVPLILTSLVQALFNAVDMAVLRVFASTVAVASVGAIGPISGLLVNSAIGLSSGTSIILARCIGARDDRRSSVVVGTSIVLSLTVGTVLAIVGYFLAPWLLDITECVDECYDGARMYLAVYCLSMPAIMLYNFGAAIIRVSGDSKRPLIYMIFAGVTNIVLNFILCATIEEKVLAVAVATVASQVVGAVLVTLRLLRCDGACRLDLKRIAFSFGEGLKLIKVGLPAALNSSLYCIANLQVQSAINSFGAAAVAGNIASVQIETVPGSVSGSFQTTALTFMGQNIGAGKPDRVRKSLLYCLLLSVGGCLVLCVSMYFAGELLLGLFIPQDELAVTAMAVGLRRMLFLFLPFPMHAAFGLFGSAVQAFGYPNFTSFSSIVTVLVYRVIWMNLIYPYLPTVGDPAVDIRNVYSCFLSSWVLTLLIFAVMLAIVYRRYMKGRVRAV